MADILSALSEFLQGMLSEGFKRLYDLLESAFSFVIDLFFDFFSDHSDDLSTFGSSFISVFDSFSFDVDSLSFDFIYLFIGILAVAFLFKLTWNLICSFF